MVRTLLVPALTPLYPYDSTFHYYYYYYYYYYYLLFPIIVLIITIKLLQLLSL
jgi:hypothetical protein